MMGWVALSGGSRLKPTHFISLGPQLGTSDATLTNLKPITSGKRLCILLVWLSPWSQLIYTGVVFN